MKLQTRSYLLPITLLGLALTGCSAAQTMEVERPVAVQYHPTFDSIHDFQSPADAAHVDPSAPEIADGFITEQELEVASSRVASCLESAGMEAVVHYSNGSISVDRAGLPEEGSSIDDAEQGCIESEFLPLADAAASMLVPSVNEAAEIERNVSACVQENHSSATARPECEELVFVSFVDHVNNQWHETELSK